MTPDRRFGRAANSARSRQRPAPVGLLTEREALGTTALGQGVSFPPAPSSPGPHAFARLFAVLADLLHGHEGRRRLRAVECFADLERLLRDTVWPRILEVLSQ